MIGLFLNLFFLVEGGGGVLSHLTVFHYGLALLLPLALVDRGGSRRRCRSCTSPYFRATPPRYDHTSHELFLLKKYCDRKEAGSEAQSALGLNNKCRESVSPLSASYQRISCIHIIDPKRTILNTVAQNRK